MIFFLFVVGVFSTFPVALNKLFDKIEPIHLENIINDLNQHLQLNLKASLKSDNLLHQLIELKPDLAKVAKVIGSIYKTPIPEVRQIYETESIAFSIFDSLILNWNEIFAFNDNQLYPNGVIKDISQMELVLDALEKQIFESNVLKSNYASHFYVMLYEIGQLKESMISQKQIFNPKEFIILLESLEVLMIQVYNEKYALLELYGSFLRLVERFHENIYDVDMNGSGSLEDWNWTRTINKLLKEASKRLNDDNTRQMIDASIMKSLVNLNVEIGILKDARKNRISMERFHHHDNVIKMIKNISQAIKTIIKPISFDEEQEYAPRFHRGLTLRDHKEVAGFISTMRSLPRIEHISFILKHSKKQKKTNFMMMLTNLILEARQANSASLAGSLFEKKIALLHVDLMSSLQAFVMNSLGLASEEMAQQAVETLKNDYRIINKYAQEKARFYQPELEKMERYKSLTVSLDKLNDHLTLGSLFYENLENRELFVNDFCAMWNSIYDAVKALEDRDLNGELKNVQILYKELQLNTTTEATPSLVSLVNAYKHAQLAIVKHFNGNEETNSKQMATIKYAVDRLDAEIKVIILGKVLLENLEEILFMPNPLLLELKFKNMRKVINKFFDLIESF